MLDNHALLIAKREEFSHQPLIPPPLITGNDLIALGWKPSPKFAEILQAVQTRQLEGSLTTQKEALEWVKTSQTHFDIASGKANFKKNPL
jgi:poly(A) polymerase